MPFTPFHLGPAILFGLLLRKYIDIPTLVAASLLVDARATLVFFGLLDGPLHGFLHTFLFSSMLGLVIAGTAYYIRPYTGELMAFFRLKQLDDWRSFVFAGLIGTWSAVILDSFLYTDIQPFMPLNVNPFYKVFSVSDIYLFCIITFILGAVYYFYLIINGE